MAGINASRKKVTGKSGGTTGTYKKSGYADGGVPKGMIPAKPGVGKHGAGVLGGPMYKGYTGPDVEEGKF